MTLPPGEAFWQKPGGFVLLFCVGNDRWLVGGSNAARPTENTKRLPIGGSRLSFAEKCSGEEGAPQEQRDGIEVAALANGSPISYNFAGHVCHVFNKETGINLEA